MENKNWAGLVKSVLFGDPDEATWSALADLFEEAGDDEISGKLRTESCPLYVVLTEDSEYNSREALRYAEGDLEKAAVGFIWAKFRTGLQTKAFSEGMNEGNNILGGFWMHLDKEGVMSRIKDGLNRPESMGRRGMMLSMPKEKPVLKFDVTVSRRTRKKLSPQKMKDQLLFIAGAAKRNQTSGFTTSIPKRLVREVECGEGENRELHYTAVISVLREKYKDADAVRRRFEHAKTVMIKAANRVKWEVVGEEPLVPGEDGEYIPVNGAGEPVGDPAPRLIQSKPKKETSPYLAGQELPPLTDEVLKTYFHRIYDRDSHIRIIYDNLKTAVKTKFKTRHHILLKGKPACAKTELFLAFIDWLGDDLVEQIDASTMTKAGLERMLLDKANDGTLKPILLLEEIEKCADENISCLIQVMDARGKIQRVNAHTIRDGETSAECRPVLWGTCNDEGSLKKFHDGAIWSRFSNKLTCQRPDRDLMEKILFREVAEIGGHAEWVPVVLQFCYDELRHNAQFKDDFDDPRFARALLAGGERLLDDGPEGYLSDFRKVCGVKRG